jgi:hypothetical protein
VDYFPEEDHSPDLEEEEEVPSHKHHNSRINERVVEIDVYCTRKCKTVQETERSSNVEEGHEVQLDEPYYNICSHRPDLDVIFEETKRKALDLGETNIAVFGCGPASMMYNLQEACRKHSQSVVGCEESGGVFFDLHMETFEF